MGNMETIMRSRNMKDSGLAAKIYRHEEGPLQTSREKPVRVLIVEDDELQAAFLRADLERIGFSVVGTLNEGAAAVAAADMERPDAVFMDIELQGEITGLLASEIISDELNIPVIYVSAHAAEEFGDALEYTNAMAFLSKPYTENELLEILRLLLCRSTPPRPCRCDTGTIL